MTQVNRLLLLATLLAALLAGCSKPETKAAAAATEAHRSVVAPTIALSNSAASPEELADRFLQAIAAKDLKAIEQLRVTEDEYRTLVLPGSVKPGEAPRNFPDDPRSYYWKLLDTKSRYSLAALLGKYGGHEYHRKGMEYRKGTREYLWYRSYEKLALRAEDNQGKDTEISTGSIIEVNGRYKFVSFYGG